MSLSMQVYAMCKNGGMNTATPVSVTQRGRDKTL